MSDRVIPCRCATWNYIAKIEVLSISQILAPKCRLQCAQITQRYIRQSQACIDKSVVVATLRPCDFAVFTTSSVNCPMMPLS